LGGTASSFEVSRFERLPVLGILRGVNAESLPGVLDACEAAGLEHLEITLNTPDAFSLINKAVDTHGTEICIGAGTVLLQEEAQKAHSSGASFIVSPTVCPAVASYCRQHQLPHFPGALTPTEIETAWRSKAQMIKVFPASVMGPGYFKEVKGPFNDIPLMAVGGIRKENIAEYLSAGASAIAVGGSIFSIERMQNAGFSAIQKDLEDILFAVKNFSNTMK